MNNITNHIKLFFSFILVAILVSSCSPVNRATRVKKIPQEYSMNYSAGAGEIKAPKTDINKEPWIVFSDKEKNMTFSKPGGKIKFKDVDFLDAFMVIKQKDDYLRLIKYTPEIFKNGKLDYKKAEYFGWIHKSQLLLNQQSVTDMISGKKKKMMVMVSDTAAINSNVVFHEKDSILVFRNLDKNNQDKEKLSRKVLPYSIVYQLKMNKDRKQSLISTKPYINADNVQNEVLGWIDNSLVKEIGLGLHVGLHSMPFYTLQATLNEEESKGIDHVLEENNYLAKSYSSTKFSPVLSYSVQDTMVAYRVKIAQPVLDNSDNYIFSVNGNPINYRGFRKLEEDMKNINVLFVFDGKEQTITHFPQIVNAIQGMQPLFEQPGDSCSYKFSAVLTFDDSKKQVNPVNIGLVSEYSTLINFLAEKASNRKQLTPIKLPRTWGGLRKAVDMLDNHRNATNLIVLIGEKGSMSEGVDSTLVERLEQNNCRILGFQVYSGEENVYNNFVLEIESMINGYSTSMLKSKGDILVSNAQIRRTNLYKEIPNAKNSFRLDFPDNSITEGGVLFPQKGEMLSLDILSNNLDTIMQQIKFDNSSVIKYMKEAFIQVGHNRPKYANLFLKQYELNHKSPSRKFASGFNNNPLGWSIISNIVYLSEKEDHHVDYRLMLIESETDDLKKFIDGLSHHEVEVKYRGQKIKNTPKDLCNCPDDNLFRETNRNYTITTNPYKREESEEPRTERKYENTSKVRKYLKQYYIKSLKEHQMCKIPNLGHMTLAEAHRTITGIPTTNSLLKFIKIKDIGNKRKVTDEMLDELIEYFKQKRDFLTKQGASKFKSNDETYYWIDRKFLP